MSRRRMQPPELWARLTRFVRRVDCEPVDEIDHWLKDCCSCLCSPIAATVPRELTDCWQCSKTQHNWGHQERPSEEAAYMCSSAEGAAD